jgi:hypothetical protein
MPLRLLFITGAHFLEWRSALRIVKPATVIAWHRKVSTVLDLESPQRPNRRPTVVDGNP